MKAHIVVNRDGAKLSVAYLGPDGAAAQAAWQTSRGSHDETIWNRDVTWNSKRHKRPQKPRSADGSSASSSGSGEASRKKPGRKPKSTTDS